VTQVTPNVLETKFATAVQSIFSKFMESVITERSFEELQYLLTAAIYSHSWIAPAVGM